MRRKNAGWNFNSRIDLGTIASAIARYSISEIKLAESAFLNVFAIKIVFVIKSNYTSLKFTQRKKVHCVLEQRRWCKWKTEVHGEKIVFLSRFLNYWIFLPPWKFSKFSCLRYIFLSFIDLAAGNYVAWKCERQTARVVITKTYSKCNNYRLRRCNCCGSSAFVECHLHT